MADAIDLTPAYVATCPECRNIVGVSVADVDSDSMRFAVMDRQDWIKRGLIVKTQTVQDVHDHGGPLGHLPTCSKKRPKLAGRSQGGEAR